jgi:hypothetical protein
MVPLKVMNVILLRIAKNVMVVVDAKNAKGLVI